MLNVMVIFFTRNITVRALAKKWNNLPQMFELFCTIAFQNALNPKYKIENVTRTIVLRSIVENYLDRPGAIDLLVDRSNKDPDEKVRKFAEEQLVIWRSRSIS